MSESSRIRDPVHNFIALREIEMKLLATPAVQRLRGIRQLAMANLVYPGALHSRFDHSLGVCHVAGLMADRLDLNPDHSELVRFAALLHDLGHGPFSHVSEYALERYANREALPPDQKKEKIHELITAHVIEHDPEIGRYLSEDTRARIVRLLAKGHGPPVLRSIVSGPIDADKQDYLLRDSQFCGVQYGVFDIHQLHRSMVKVGHDDEQELMIDPDGVHALEQFVMAKYYLTTNVYRHRVRLVTDQMIVRAIVLGIEVDQIDALRELYTFDNTDDFFRRYTRFDDARFMFEFDSRAKPGTHCGDLLTRLQRRQLHKRVFTARIEEFDDPQLRPALQDISKPYSSSLRKSVEQRLAGVLDEQFHRKIDPFEVIVHGFDIKSVRTTSRNDEGAIMIDRRPQPVPFDQDSTLFASIDEGYAEASIEVYVPVTWETPTERGRFLKSVREPIQEGISSAVKEAIQKGDNL